MDMFLFEWKKLFRSRLIYLYLAVSVAFPALLFAFNFTQLDRTEREMRATFESTITHANVLIQTSQFAKESRELAPDEISFHDKLIDDASEILTNSQKSLEAVTIRDASVFLASWIKHFDLIETFQETYDPGTVIVFPFNHEMKQLQKQLVLIKQAKLTYEDPKNSINRPHFFVQLSNVIFSTAGILLLLLLFNLPLLTDFETGRLRFSFAELIGKEKTYFRQLHLFQSSLALVVLLIGFGCSYLLTTFFGKGLIEDVTNTFAYPAFLLPDGQSISLGLLLISQLSVFLSFLFFLNQFFHLLLFKSMKIIVASLVFLLLNVSLVFSTTKLELAGFLQPWLLWTNVNPYDVIQQPLEILLVLGVLFVLQLLTAAYLNHRTTFHIN